VSFVDEVRLRVRAGDGGGGGLSFLRTKLQPKGGPNGGDGGRGGSVIAVADAGLGSLAPYVRNRVVRAENGQPGGPHNRNGADGSDVVVTVPVGTVVKDAGEVLADLAKPDSRYVLARGGRGGRGNAALKSSRDRLPNYSEPGEPGQEYDVTLELHLVADVGLLGPPNAGKSTLLGAVSRATPKIGAYPFTTIDPNLGIVDVDDETRLTVADLPGLIEGASEGKGLGLRFLRHAQRCSLLALVVDVAGDDPVGDLDSVYREVEAFDSELAKRARVVIANKIDLGGELDAIEAWTRDHDAEIVAISAADGVNLDDLRGVLGPAVARAKAELGEPQSFAVYRPAVEDRIVVHREDGAFRVRSERIERAVAQTPIANARALRRLQRRLKTMGVERALKREGAKEGDEVRIGEIAFEWIPDDA
jgi:GTP-binding protein